MRPPACLAFAGWICPGRLPPALRGAFAWRTDRATPSALRAGGRAARPQGLRRAGRTGRSCCLRRNQPARPGPLPCCASGTRTHPQFLWISRWFSAAILWCVWVMAACCRNRQCCGAAAHAAPGCSGLRFAPAATRRRWPLRIPAPFGRERPARAACRSLELNRPWMRMPRALRSGGHAACSRQVVHNVRLRATDPAGRSVASLPLCRWSGLRPA